MTKMFETGLPQNVRFAQRLKDLNKDIYEYFEVEENDVKARNLCLAVFTRFYDAEIGITELDIFDLKIKNTFDILVPTYKALLTAKEKMLNNAENGLTESRTETSENVITYDNKLVDKTGADGETNTRESVVYTDVLKEDNTRRYEIEHNKSGTDEHSDTRTSEIKRAGAPSFYSELTEAAKGNIYHTFTENFVKFFSEVF